ncbi:hypothetical protein C882_4438 [Caenispirillum salinarum AK4]|uniref:Uncharacterized protein n=1 Tax=Caenispirillum salinarum AK4 TaxID=1238182 RepID=K9H098_9PROT|nr:hypothetical protein [Caenispirillum salinarum]EKV30479.1 hypothetical protein C882_4438 [Caenispirillum salinarum AK4]
MTLRKSRFSAKTALTALVLGLTAPVLAACEDEGPAEQLGENIDESVEESGEAMEDAAENMGEQMEETGDTMQEQAQ